MAQARAALNHFLKERAFSFSHLDLTKLPKCKPKWLVTISAAAISYHRIRTVVQQNFYCFSVSVLSRTM